MSSYMNWLFDILINVQHFDLKLSLNCHNRNNIEYFFFHNVHLMILNKCKIVLMNYG